MRAPDLAGSLRRRTRELLVGGRDPLRLFLGHHRSASTWMSRRVLYPVCARVGLHWSYSHTPSQLEGALVRRAGWGSPGLHCYVNADPAALRRIGPFRGIHLIRDPRDVIVSGYYSHRDSHPIGSWRELVAHRRLLRSLSPEAGLLAEIEFSSRLPTEGVELQPFRALAEWDYSQPHVLELRFEELVSEPLRAVLEALRFLDLLGSGPWRLSQQRAARILETVSYEQLTGGRAPGQPDSRSHYRMGTAGQWRTHFGKVHKLAFEKRHPGLLRWLGYEQGDDW